MALPALAQETLSKIQPGWDETPTTPAAVVSQNIVKKVPGAQPTSFWARLAQVGVGKVTVAKVAKSATSAGKSVENFAKNTAVSTAKSAIGAGEDVTNAIGNTEVRVASKLGIKAKTGTQTNKQQFGQKLGALGGTNAKEEVGNIVQTASLGIPGGGKAAEITGGFLIKQLGEQGVKELAQKAGIDATKGEITDVAEQVAKSKVGQQAGKVLMKGGQSVATKALKSSAIGAVTGGTYGAGQAASQNKSGKQILESAGENAAVGAVVGGGSSLLKSAASKVTGKTAAGKEIINKATTHQANEKMANEKGLPSGPPTNQLKTGSAPKQLPSGGEKVSGKGFTASSKSSPEATAKGQEINRLQNRVTAFQQGKLQISPDQAKSEAKQLAALKGGGKVNALTTASKKSVAAKVEEPSLTSGKLSRPKSAPTEQKPLVNENKAPAKGLGGLVSKAASKIGVSGKINPEQELLNKGHTQAAQVVRDISASRDLGNYRGERAQALFDSKATKEEQNYDKFAAQRESDTGTSAAHKEFSAGLQDTGKRGEEAGTIEKARGSTYAPRYAKFKDNVKQVIVGGLRKSGGFSKGRVQAGEFGLGGDKYKTYAEFKQAVEAGGGKTPKATTGEIYGHTIASREKAIANARGIAKLEKTPMKDGRAAIITHAPGKTLPPEYSGYDENLLPGRAIHPDLVPAIRTFVESPRRNPLTGLNAITKRLVTLNGTVHDLNFARSSIGEQGLAKTVKNFHPVDIVQKGINSPQYHADTERMIKNGMVTSRTGLANIFDEVNSSINKKVDGVLGKIRGKMDAVTFGIGDNLGRSTYLKIEKGLLNKGLTAKEAGQIAADTANRVMFTEREGQQSSEAKAVGRVALFAKNFFQSTIQKATTATGISRNTALSKGAQRAGQVQAAKALAKSFTFLFAAAQAINYRATGHSTFSNKDSKISPVFYVDKTTGKEYHLTNWYGQVGEILHLTDPKSILSKASPVIQEGSRLMNAVVSGAPDPYSGQTVINKNASDIRQWGEALANTVGNMVTPLGFQLSNTQRSTPGAVNAAKFFGFGASTVDQNQLEKDVANQYYATLPSGASKTPPAMSALEAAARNDLAKGRTNSSNVQKLKSQMTSTQFSKFMKTGADTSTQREFDGLSPATKLGIIEKYSPQQLKELDLTGVAKTLVGTRQKSSVTALETKGFSAQRILNDLKKVGIGQSQLQQFRIEAKRQASLTSKKAASEPKFVNPLLQ